MPFLRYEFLATWWKTLGGGEWDSGELYVITARNDAGSLLGIAPLFLTQNSAEETALMFLGSFEISDYLDFITLAEGLDAFVDAIFAHLTGPEAPAWDVLDFYNLLDDSPSLSALEAAAKKFGLSHQQEQLQPAPLITLADDWETYLEGLQGKQRREIRRKLRNAAGFFAPVDWYIVEDEATLDAEIDAFMELMAHDPQKAAFLTEVMRTQMRSAVHTAFQAGWLQLAFLTAGGKKAAAYLNFDYRDQIWVYNSGIDFKYQSLSPGWVLLSYLIQWAIDNERESLDMMRGDEVYKYRFGGVDRFVLRVQIRR